MASFTKEVNWRLAKLPLVFNGRLANCGLTSLVKEATANRPMMGQNRASTGPMLPASAQFWPCYGLLWPVFRDAHHCDTHVTYRCNSLYMYMLWSYSYFAVNHLSNTI